MEHQEFTIATREQWYNELAAFLAPEFEKLNAPLPDRIRMSVGFPKGRRSAVGQWYGPSRSEDSTHEIFISPEIADSVRAAGIAAHELTHAAVGSEAGHGAPFKRVATGLGLEGKMTATTEGEKFIAMVRPFIDRAGDLPHAPLDGSTPKKQGTRLIKAVCAGCGYNVRITRTWLDSVGAPHCPIHGEMSVSQ